MAPCHPLTPHSLAPPSLDNSAMRTTVGHHSPSLRHCQGFQAREGGSGCGHDTRAKSQSRWPGTLSAASPICFIGSSQQCCCSNQFPAAAPLFTARRRHVAAVAPPRRLGAAAEERRRPGRRREELAAELPAWGYLATDGADTAGQRGDTPTEDHQVFSPHL